MTVSEKSLRFVARKMISGESSLLLKKGLHVSFFLSTVANETGESSARPLARFAREYVESNCNFVVDFPFTLKLFPASVRKHV